MSETVPEDKLETEFVAAGTAGDVFAGIAGQERKMAVVAEIEAFFDDGPAVGFASAHFIPEPEYDQEDQPEQQIDAENMKTAQNKNIIREVLNDERIVSS